MDLKSQVLQRKLRPLTALGIILLSVESFAQPVCSIDIGPDHTICEGETVTLNGPAGYNNYLWSNGSTANSITVGTSGNYSVQVSYPSGELVTNGNFDGGNSGFGTEFSYSPLLQNDGNYFIGTNAAFFHPQFVGTGNGNFLMINSGWWHGNWEAWCQSVPVCPGQTYSLRFRAVSLADVGFPTLQWFVNDEPTWVNHQTPSQNNWQYFTTLWTAPPGVTNATFCIRVTSANGVGNDFGLDEISISSTITLTDDVNVNVTPLPVFDLGANATLCTGESLLLDAAVPGGSYLWQDGSTASSYQVNSPGDYSVTVTANGCSSTDAISVSYLPAPQVDLGPGQTLCEGETLLIDATAGPGATYSWQDGSTAPTYTVTQGGIYMVNVTLNGCTASDAINVTYNSLPVVDLGPNQTICAGEQILFDVTTPNATYLWQDGSIGSTFTATTAGQVSVDVTVNGCTGSDAANVIVNPVPIVDLGPDQTVCPGTAVDLDAALPGATYTWSTGATTPSITVNGAGNYWVDVTVNGCTGSDTVSINEFVLPVVDLGDDLAFCEGSSVQLGMPIANSTFLWSIGETTATISVDTPGEFWVEVAQNGCTVSDTIEVTEIPLPVVDLGAAPTICPGTSVTLDASIAGATYSWSTGETTATVEAEAGSYSVNVTVNGCTSSASITVTEFAVDPIDLGNDTTLCPGEELVLSAAQPGATYLWQDGSTASTFVVNDAGDHSVTVTDQNGCVSSDQISVAYASPTAVDLGPDATICEGTDLVLDATLPGASYLWSTGATSASITVNSSGSYDVVVTQGNCTVSDQIEIEVVAAPIFSIGNDTTLCPGATLMLEVDQPGSSIAWSTGGSGNSIIVDQAGTYSATVTNGAGCSTTASIDVAYASPDAVDLGPDISICEGEELLLDATLPGANYLWSTGATSATITVSSESVYWVEVSQGACSTTDTIALSVEPTPVIDLGNDQTLCAGESTTLDATWPGATYTWSTGATTPTITADQTGLYSVIVDLNGCTSSDQVEITVLNGASIELGPDITACSSEQIILDASAAGATHLWSTGATSQTLEITATGSYWVNVTLGNCVVSDSIDVVIDPSPEVELGDDQILCAGDVIELDATWAGATYSWNTGASTPILQVDQSGTYSVTIDLDGCTATDAVEITVLDPLVLDLGEDAELCTGEELVLDATAPGDHLWSTGSTDEAITVNSSGTYWVQVTQGTCITSDTITVIVNDPGSIDLGDDQSICEGESVTLDASLPNATYQWQDGNTSAVRTITTSGVYEVTATVGNCTVSDQVEITVHPVPVIELGEDLLICPNETASFDVTTPGATYIWQDGSTAPIFTASTSTEINVTVSIGNCSASDQVLVTQVEGPTADLGTNTVICEGSTITFNVEQPLSTYLWDDGSSGAERTIDEPGTYWVNVYRNSCVDSDTIEVDLFTPAMVDLGSDISLCPGTSVEIFSPIPNGNNTWSTGSTAPSIVIEEVGTYWLDVGLNDCQAADTITVSMIELNVADLGADQMICAGEAITLEVDAGNAAVTWSTGATTNSIEVSGTGSYSVTLQNEGCTSTDQVEIEVMDQITTIDLGAARSICPDEIIVLDATLPIPADHVWSNGAIGPILEVTEPGVYQVEAIGACVNAIGTVMITEGECGPTVYLPNSFTPNDDGINDVFKAEIDGDLSNYRLEIFDRWGELIFSSADASAGWDGSVSGDQAPDGVYIWKLFYRSASGAANRSNEIGHVTLLR